MKNLLCKISCRNVVLANVTCVDVAVAKHEQVIEERQFLHQLCQSIHSEESNQLATEDKQARCLQSTCLDDFDIKGCLGGSTSRRGRYGCNSVIYQVEKTNTAGGIDIW